MPASDDSVLSARGARSDERDVTRVAAKDRGIRLHNVKGPTGFSALLPTLAAKRSAGEQHLSRFKEALADSGKVILLDDPFGQLDPQTRAECFELIRKASPGRIIVFASSQFDQIAAVADKVVILANGEMVQAGTPNEIYENPETVAAAQITGENNLFAARRLTSTDAELPEFQTLEGSHRIFAQPVKKARLGSINQNVMLAIRPEQVAMSMGASFPEDNLIKAIVTGHRFLGPTSIIEFDAGGLKLETRVFKIVGLSIGDECMLGLPPHRILILKD